jgi:hypothetical protein
MTNNPTQIICFIIPHTSMIMVKISLIKMLMYFMKRSGLFFVTNLASWITSEGLPLCVSDMTGDETHLDKFFCT